MIKVTYKLRMWLDSRGGRNASDVMEDEEGMFVLMGSGFRGKLIKAYLPDESRIVIIKRAFHDLVVVKPGERK